MTFAKGLVASGIVASFSAKGTPYDNSVKESFFATLEKEHLRSRTFETARGGAELDLSLHRGLVQPAPVALDARVPLP